jgi:hypothetical protein
MPDKNQITTESKIVFSLKGFITTITSILTIFASFYFMVIDPRIDTAEANTEKLLDAKVNTVNVQLIEIKKMIEQDHETFKNGINANKDASAANTHRFKDINQTVNNIENQGGSSTSNR